MAIARWRVLCAQMSEKVPNLQASRCENGGRTTACCGQLPCKHRSKLSLDQDTDRVNRSLTCYGAVGVPRRLMNMAVRVNREKSQFKATFREIANKRVRIAGRDSNNRPVVELKAVAMVILRQLQSSSVNRLAAYREVRLFDATPLSIAFTESYNRSVPTKSAAELIAELTLRVDAAQRKITGD